MTNVHSPEVRSLNMSHIRAKNTKPEIIVRKFLFHQGFRYRLYSLNLPGKPDIVLPKYKTVIFVNGCFWHGHEGCKYASLPKSNIPYWSLKIKKNKERDSRNEIKLINAGWNIIYVWECELKKNLEITLINLIKIRGSK